MKHMLVKTGKVIGMMKKKKIIWTYQLVKMDLGISQNDTQTSEDSLEEQPLYAGTPITLGSGILLTLTFAMSYSLSGEALLHLLELIDAHCITPNLYTTSIAKFKRYFKQLKTLICYHYYCPFCHGLLGDGVNTQNCTYCGLSLQQDAKLKKSLLKYQQKSNQWICSQVSLCNFPEKLSFNYSELQSFYSPLIDVRFDLKSQFWSS